MSSPIELLREGILQGDWAKVCGGFENLTGMTVVPPAATKSDFTDNVCYKKLAAIFDDLGNFFSDDPPSSEKVEPNIATLRPKVAEETTDLDKFKVQPKQAEEKAAKPRLFQPGLNLWKDDGSIAPEDIESSKALSAKKTPSPRRPEVKKFPVTCCKCSKKEEVEPIFVPRVLDKGGEATSYVCNDCVTKGRR